MTDLGHFLLGPTGLISRELTAHTKSILGVDISQGVVDFYNNRFASQGLPLMGGLLPGDTHILMNTRIRTLTSIPLRLATATLLRFTATSNMA